MADYPRMLYRKGGSKSAELHGFKCDTMIADSAEDEDYFTRAEGWRRTPAEAHGEKPDAPVPDTPEATELQEERDALLQELKDLEGDGEAKDKRIGELTAEVEDLRKQLEGKPTDQAVTDLYKEMDELRASLATAEKERDDAKEGLAKFDRDGDGKPGGSKAKKET